MATAIVAVRQAVASDIELILRIDSQAPIDQSRRALVNSAVDRGECFIALQDGFVIGYAVMNYLFFDRGFVPLIHVDTNHRRRKVGSRLFDELEERCRTSRIFTSMNLSNLPMLRFLSARGYVLSGIVQDLDENDPELLYSKKLR